MTTFSQNPWSYLTPLSHTSPKHITNELYIKTHAKSGHFSSLYLPLCRSQPTLCLIRITMKTFLSRLSGAALNPSLYLYDTIFTSSCLTLHQRYFLPSCSLKMSTISLPRTLALAVPFARNAFALDINMSSFQCVHTCYLLRKAFIIQFLLSKSCHPQYLSSSFFALFSRVIIAIKHMYIFVCIKFSCIYIYISIFLSFFARMKALFLILLAEIFPFLFTY